MASAGIPQGDASGLIFERGAEQIGGRVLHRRLGFGRRRNATGSARRSQTVPHLRPDKGPVNSASC